MTATNWTERARAFLKAASKTADETDETRLSSVSAVHPHGHSEESSGPAGSSALNFRPHGTATRQLTNCAQATGHPTDETAKKMVSSVLAVGHPAAFTEFVAANDGTTVGQAQVMSRSGGRYALAPDEAARCHAQPWGDAACGRFVARVTKLLRLGVPAGDADDLAERMHLRDFEGDDRRACFECGGLTGHAASGWRCRRAALAGCGVQLAPDLVTRLQRCPGHTPVA